MLLSKIRPNETIRHRLSDALHPISDKDAWNRLLARINPLWAIDGARARVLSRVEESADTISLWLEPNRHWRGHRAGQHIELGVEIEGVRRRRVFSLSNAGEANRSIRITLQRQAAGGVTDWLHTHARPGLIVDIGTPGGEFVLPKPVPKRLLMIAGGSGITPLLAMLHSLADDAPTTDILFFQLFRDPEQRLFSEELAALSRRLTGLEVHTNCSAESGRLSASTIASQVGDLAQRQTLVCGPDTLMTEVAEVWGRSGLLEKLQIERFGAPRPAARAGSDTRVNAVTSEQVFTQTPGLTLLESAEAAGLRPKFGCRAGLCRTCLCRKRRGQVRNLVTGLVSSQPDEWVQLCISVAESDLELAL